jgi:hydroxyquinol 1,2-dioxygenase
MNAKTDHVSRNLNEHNITEAVVQRFANTPDARLKEIVSSLVKHLHDFARETKLTEAEWLAGIEYLTRTGQKCTRTRQEFVLLSDTLGLSQLVVAQSHSRDRRATEQTVFGPFHFPGPKLPSHGADLAQGMPGDHCYVTATVTDLEGKTLADAMVDVWHSDADGFYDVQDPNWTPETTKLRAIFRTDAKGQVSFRTVQPCAYPIPTDGPVGEMLTATKRHPMRPGHIHFLIESPGFDPLITHIFVDGDEYLDSDAVFAVRSSCIGDYKKHPAGSKAPDGGTPKAPFYTLDYRFVLQPI